MSNQDFIPVASPSLGGEERDLLIDAFDSSWIGSAGKYLTRFEDEFAKRCRVAHALAVSNGTVALHLALVAAGVGPGDEVIVPSLTYIATANAVRYCGAEPVFADVLRSDWGLSSVSVSAMIGPRTKAMIAVHLYGLPADMLSLRKICDQHGLALIEDAAEAPFAEREGYRAGELGDIATFSFYGNKIITSGEGGAVVTNDPSTAARLRLLRGQGMDPERRYWFPELGYNYRLTNMQGAILCAQLSRLDDLLAERRAIYSRYDEAFAGQPGLERQPCVPRTTPAPWLYCLLLTDRAARDGLAGCLEEALIESRPFFIPLHLMPPHTGARRDDLPVTLELSSRGINLPTFPDLRPDAQDRVIDAVLVALKSTPVKDAQ